MATKALAQSSTATAAAVIAPEETAASGTPAAPKVHEISKRSPWGALLSRTLPAYSGEYSVGVCDIEVPVEPQTFGTFRHKTMTTNGVAGLRLDTALFSLFYPCETPEDPNPVVWFPSLRQTIDGFLKMAKRTPNFWYRMVSYPLAAAAISGTTFPASKNASILTPPSPDKPWPLVIFSHGVGCSRLMYSAFCGELASRGYVVAVLEHRDGTSPSSKITAADGTTRPFDWLQWSDLEWPDLEVQPTDDTILRHEQVAFRCAEIEAVVQTVHALSRGEAIDRYSLDAPHFDWSRWKGAVDPSTPIMAGHSLGGSAALASSAAGKIPYRAVVVFDPAVQRLEPWTKAIPHPLLVINSEEFAVGKEYKIFAEQVAGTLVPEDAPLVFSIPGATHPSFSDVFLILPEYVNKLTGLRVSAARVLELTVNATYDFLKGDGHNIPKRCRRYDPKPAPGGKLTVREGAHGEVDDDVGEVPKPVKPLGTPGELVWHPF